MTCLSAKAIGSSNWQLSSAHVKPKVSVQADKEQPLREQWSLASTNKAFVAHDARRCYINCIAYYGTAIVWRGSRSGQRLVTLANRCRWIDPLSPAILGDLYSALASAWQDVLHSHILLQRMLSLRQARSD